MVSSINRTKFQRRDYASRNNVYLGLHYPNVKENYGQSPLKVLNYHGLLNEDLTRTFVICE